MATIIRRRKLGMSSAKGIADFSKTGITWCRNDKGIPDDNLYIRWGCTSNVPNPNATVLNPAKAIHQVNDKLGFRKTLDESELCPATHFFTAQEAAMYEPNINTPDGEFVARPPTHAQGRNIFAGNFAACVAQLNRWGKGGGYVSRKVDKVAEYRVFVVQGRAVCVAQKTPADANALAWNVAKGGRFDNVRWDNWPLQAVRRSIEAFNLTKLDFGGVDVMVDANGDSTILEINSAPSLTSPYRQECMAKAFDYIVENGRERIPLIEARGGYKKFVHPAVCENAQLV